MDKQTAKELEDLKAAREADSTWYPIPELKDTEKQEAK